MKEVKTIVLPVKYRKNKRFYKKDIKSIDYSNDMFDSKPETLITTRGNTEYIIDLPCENVKKICGFVKND